MKKLTEFASMAAAAQAGFLPKGGRTPIQDRIKGYKKRYYKNDGYALENIEKHKHVVMEWCYDDDGQVTIWTYNGSYKEKMYQKEKNLPEVASRWRAFEDDLDNLF